MSPTTKTLKLNSRFSAGRFSCECNLGVKTNIVWKRNCSYVAFLKSVTYHHNFVSWSKTIYLKAFQFFAREFREEVCQQRRVNISSEIYRSRKALNFYELVLARVTRWGRCQYWFANTKENTQFTGTWVSHVKHFCCPWGQLHTLRFDKFWFTDTASFFFNL